MLNIKNKRRRTDRSRRSKELLARKNLLEIRREVSAGEGKYAILEARNASGRSSSLRILHGIPGADAFVTTYSRLFPPFFFQDKTR